MASLYGRVILRNLRQPIFCTTVRGKKEIAEHIDHATGLERQELLAKLAGNDDPFCMKAMKRGPGTKDCPNLVPSAFDSRIIGCICEEESLSINWMWLHKGQSRRCECGHWFKLVDRPDCLPH